MGVNTLDSVWLKIDHAKLHMDAAKSEIQRYLDSNQSEFVPDANSSLNQPTFLIKPSKPIPDKIALIVGDCIQNLRDALDYLVWELVLVAKNPPNEKNMFPIYLTLKGFQGAQSAGRLQGIDDPAVITLIEAFQPYHDGQPSATCLAILNELANINKHRRLILTEFSTLSLSEMSDTMDKWLKAGSPELTGLAHNAGIGRVVTPEQMKMQGDLVPFVAFNEGAVKEMEVGFALDGLMIYVNALVKRFEVFCP